MVTVSWVQPPLALLLASLDLYACSSEHETGKMQFPKLALLRVVFAASLSEGVLASRRLFPRWCERFHSWRDYWYEVTNRFAISYLTAFWNYRFTLGGYNPTAASTDYS